MNWQAESPFKYTPNGETAMDAMDCRDV